MSLADLDRTDSYRASLLRLLPSGYAWAKTKGSAQYAWVTAEAQDYSEFERFSYRTMEQCWPHASCNRLAEWLGAVGLPGQCFPGASNVVLRAQMLGRLRGLSGLAYDDASPAAPESIKALCAVLGYDVDVWYNTYFRVGRDSVTQRIGYNDGLLNVQINRVSTPFRVTKNRVDERLIIASKDSEELLCYLQRVAPSRFGLRIVFNEV